MTSRRLQSSAPYLLSLLIASVSLGASSSGCGAVKPIFVPVKNCTVEVASQLLSDLAGVVKRDEPKEAHTVSQDTFLEVHRFIGIYGYQAVQCAARELLSSALRKRDMPPSYVGKLEHLGAWLDRHE